MAPIILENEMWQLGLLAETGGSIAFGKIKHQGRWVDFMRPTAVANYTDASACASYVLLPWSNRIREGKFRFRGKTYQLKINFNDGTAIHGVAKDHPWKVASSEKTRLVLTYNSADHAEVNYPFRFSGVQEFRLNGKSLEIDTVLKNEDSQAMPGGFGHHPYFQKTLEAGGSDDIHLEIPVAGWFKLDNCLPTGGPISLPAALDFRKLRALHSGLDDLFTDRDASKPIRFVYERAGREIVMKADPLYEHIIVYAPPGKDFFALEPVTNANDGFNLYDQGVAGSGTFVLEPGEQKQARFQFDVK